MTSLSVLLLFFFFQAEDGIRDTSVTGVQTCALPILLFEAPVAIQLLGHFISAVNGASLYRKTSFLLDSLGKQVFSPLVDIQERSEERRVGKERRSWQVEYDLMKKME